MLTVPEAARRSARNPETIRRWIREGKLPSSKVGTQYLIDEDDLADAIRGIFAERSAPDMVERPHRLGEVIAPYPVTPPAVPAGRASTLDDAWLPQIVGRIVRAVDPARIILFGSRARGDARPDSDYDLLVVLDELPNRREARVSIRLSFADLPVAADILVATIAEIEERPAGATYWAIHEGRRVYERAEAS